MASLVLTSATTLYGTTWGASGTAPGPGNPSVGGTLLSYTDFSDHIRQVTLNLDVNMQDFTTFGDGAFVAQKPGLKSGAISIDFNNDFAASSVDATFGAAFLNGTLIYLDIKPTNAARSATNPSYVFAGYVSKYTPVGNSVGDRAAAPVEITVTGSYGRLTS
jgi:hypothetical protein